MKTINTRLSPALEGFPDEKSNLREVCIGANRVFRGKCHNDRRRIVGHLRGQSPML